MTNTLSPSPSVYDSSTTTNFSPFQTNFHVSPDGDPEFVERGQVLVDGGNFGVSTVAFDTYEELLWMGNQGVSSFYSFINHSRLSNHST